jgi:hypothetical protein
MNKMPKPIVRGGFDVTGTLDAYQEYDDVVISVGTAVRKDGINGIIEFDVFSELERLSGKKVRIRVDLVEE